MLTSSQRLSSLLLLSRIALLAAVLPASSAGAATLTVCNFGCQYDSVQLAIDSAQPGDTIDVGPGSLTEAGILVDRDLIIEGQGRSTTFIQAAAVQGQSFLRIFTIQPGATVEIRDMTLRHGATGAGAGGAIWVRTDPTDGPASLTLDRVDVVDNRARLGGGIAVDGELDARSSSIRNNWASQDGGGLYNNGEVTLDTVDLISNYAFDGGGLHNTATGSVAGDNLFAFENTAEQAGGGLFNAGSLTLGGGNTTSISVFIQSNTADEGAGVFVDANGDTTLNATFVVGNTLAAAAPHLSCGAGIHAAGALEMTRSTLQSNQALVNPSGGRWGIGGALCISENVPVTLDDVAIEFNRADTESGIRMEDGTLTMTRSRIRENRSGNHAGGMIQYGGDAYITNTSIFENEANGNGGGFYACGGSTHMANVTIARNVANADGNASGDGGGLWHCNDTNEVVNIRSTIIAANQAIGGGYPDCQKTFDTARFSLIGNAGAAAQRCGVNGFSSGMLWNVGPWFNPIEEYGVPLSRLSPAIDAGLCVSAIGPPPLTDQIGGWMPVDGDSDSVAACDMGALEYLPEPNFATALILGAGALLTMRSRRGLVRQ